jgi:hypothetical protein
MPARLKLFRAEMPKVEPQEEVLCARCGEPVRCRRVTAEDYRVTPDGEVDYGTPIEGDVSVIQLGLYCPGCEEFIVDDVCAVDPGRIPQLLEEGRLRLQEARPRKTRKK